MTDSKNAFLMDDKINIFIFNVFQRSMYIDIESVIAYTRQ
jgi:hypothetical protein